MPIAGTTLDLTARRTGPLSVRFTRILTVGTSAPKATALGVAMCALIAGVFGFRSPQFAGAPQALILVMPVVGAAVLGGRRAAYAVGVAATVALSLVVPPLGSPRVQLTDDLIALAVFSMVVLAVGTAVAQRMELLGAVERDRSALLRSVSHDLRTPLAAIRAAASDLATNDRLPPDRAARFVDLILAESERLDRLVANLLSLSRIEAGTDAPARQAVDVGELIADTLARLARVLTRVELHVVVADDLPLLEGDYVQLDQLITNLVENAARHTPAGGGVTVEARAQAGAMTIVVTDQGPGVDPADKATLFEPFKSGRLAGTSGIGLAICKAVVDRHHGGIDVADGPRGGAAFIVRLPLG